MLLIVSPLKNNGLPFVLTVGSFVCYYLYVCVLIRSFVRSSIRLFVLSSGRSFVRSIVYMIVSLLVCLSCFCVVWFVLFCSVPSHCVLYGVPFVFRSVCILFSKYRVSLVIYQICFYGTL